MAKNIVILSDGTGNSAAKLHKTNVWRTYKAINKGSNQIAIYDDGVGTSSFRPLKLIGGAFGFGLRKNIIDLYTFLSRNYKENDLIYCFGFSRGAFTIRLLVGLIHSKGIAKGETPDELRKDAKDKYESYRKEWAERGSKEIKPPNEVINIKFVGLWDTVDAYGAPIEEIKLAINRIFQLYPPDYKLSNRVEKACHALAIDDERQTFHPLLWDEEGEGQNESDGEKRIEQVWFSGMHSNVGGGYPDDDLSFVPLVWILEKAQKAGLDLRREALNSFKTKADCHGMMYDSRSGLGTFYRYSPRRIRDFSQKYKLNKIKVHSSVIKRVIDDYSDYSPIGIPEKFEPVDSKSGNTMTTSFGKELWQGVTSYIFHRKRWYYCFIVTLSLLFLIATYTAFQADRWSFNIISMYFNELVYLFKEWPLVLLIALVSLIASQHYISICKEKTKGKAYDYFKSFRDNMNKHKDEK